MILVPSVLLELMVHKVLLARSDLPVRLVPLGRWDLQAVLRMARLDLLVPLVRKALSVRRVTLAPRDHLVLPGLKVSREMSDHRGRLAIRVRLELMALRVRWVLVVVTRVLLVLPVLRVPLVLTELRDQKVRLAHRAFRVQLEQTVHKVSRVTSVRWVHRACKVTLEYRVR